MAKEEKSKERQEEDNNIVAAWASGDRDKARAMVRDQAVKAAHGGLFGDKDNEKDNNKDEK